jgi:hypothetical protein
VTINLDDYVDVAERVRLFYEKYPDGRLVTLEHGRFEDHDRVFVWCKAAAYRSADDAQPCTGTAWEPIPGPTPYTKDSELMNAETAAWGRAIIAAGIPSKKIASAQEVRNRTADSGGESSSEQSVASPPESSKTKAELLAKLADLLALLNRADTAVDWNQSAANVSARYFDGERDFMKLQKKQLESLVAEVERWVANAQPPAPDEVPFD